MINRNLLDSVYKLALFRNKMAFISGPRQVGKTTLARNLKNYFDNLVYKNWDQDAVAKAWIRDPEILIEDFDFTKNAKNNLLILDEIHKSKNWKQKVKGLFDTHNHELKILVTGSARLNIYKKGGDSLLGRYLNFRLHPFSVGELIENKIYAPHEVINKILNPSTKSKIDEKVINTLLEYSGFPEPYLEKNKRLHSIWKKDRRERLIREDLRDLNRVQEISQLQSLALFLPEKVGSPLSVESLREDLSTSHDSVRRWLNWFQELYIHFEIKPWSKDIKRSLKKEGKLYLYDWTEVENEGAKFENLIACHLQKACHIWTDLGYGAFELHYLRNKDKEELDFLITENKKPWLAVEAKLSESKISPKIFERFGHQLNCPIVQVSMLKDIYWKDSKNKFYSLGAIEFLRYFP